MVAKNFALAVKTTIYGSSTYSFIPGQTNKQYSNAYEGSFNRLAQSVCGKPEKGLRYDDRFYVARILKSKETELIASGNTKVTHGEVLRAVMTDMGWKRKRSSTNSTTSLSEFIRNSQIVVSMPTKPVPQALKVDSYQIH